MKKLIIFVLMVSMFFVGTATVKADSWWTVELSFDEFAWSVHYDYDETYLLARALVRDGATELYISIPESDYHVFRTQFDSYLYKIQFWDTSYNLIDTFYWRDLFPNVETEARLSGIFELDLRTLGVHDENIQYFSMIIPQTPDSAIPDESDYLTYLNTNDYVLSKYPSSDYYYTFANAFGVYFRAELEGNIPYGSESIHFTGLGDYWGQKVSTLRSYLKLYDDTNTLLETIYLDDLDPPNLDSLHAFFSFDTYTIDDLDHFILGLYSMESNLSHDLLSDLNSDITVKFEDDSIRVIYWMSQDVAVRTQLVYLPTWVEPYDIEGGPVGFEFDNWYSGDGFVFDYHTMTEVDYPQYEIYVYANWIVESGTVAIDPDDPTLEPDNFLLPILSDFGWNTQTGYMMFFIGFITVVTIFLLVIKIHILGITLVNFMIFGLFHFWGMLPSYVSVIGFVLFAVLGTFSIVGLGGSQNYE